MFQKVHFRLAALCAGITSFILLAMSCAYLYISERGLLNSSFISFENDMNTLISNLEQQTVITHEWLTKIEDNGKYQINVIDNGVPFLFNERNSEEQKALFQTAWEYYESHFSTEPLLASYGTYHTEFSFSSTGKRTSDYYACVAVYERNNGTFQVMILSSLAPLKQQIHIQRLLFLGLNVLAVAALGLFAWYFTKRLLQPLEENQKKQTQFLASASHELRTPLAVILSCASASGRASGEERQHFLDSIQSEGLRMSRLIDDMLLLTNADNHNWTIRKEPAELDTLLLDTFEAFEPIAQEKSIRLSIELPDTATPLFSCDRERIRQVLSILLHNAVSYTPNGGHIRLSLSSDEKNIRLSVTDNGIGIPDSEKAHIFERFYRADQSRSQKGHFGLGLCIAAEIMKAHHGQIQVSDTPGGGATFTLIL